MYGRCGSIYVWSGVRSVLVAMRTSHNNARGQCRDTRCYLVFEVRLIISQPGNHVFSQPPIGYSRISTALLALSYRYTRIKDRPLIEPLISANYRVLGH
jgi:hypothetical protein